MGVVIQTYTSVVVYILSTMKLPCFGFRSKQKTEEKNNLINNQMLQKERTTASLLILPAATKTFNKKDKKSTAHTNKTSLQQFIDINAQTSSWYLPNITAEKSADILEPLAVGRFVIRQFESNALLLHLKTGPTASETHLIIVEKSGLCFAELPADGAKFFSNLSSLVVHHSIMQESLPVALVVAEDAMSGDSDELVDFIDIDVDPEFSDLITKL